MCLCSGSTKLQSFLLLKAWIIINSDYETGQAEQHKERSNYTPVFCKENTLGINANYTIKLEKIMSFGTHGLAFRIKMKHSNPIKTFDKL